MIDVCIVMCVMQEPQGEQCCALLCVSVCLGPDYYFTLAVRIARLWYHHVRRLTL